MTSRNLTSNFLEFRNRAARDRNFHADDRVSFAWIFLLVIRFYFQANDDQTALIQNDDEEVVQFENNLPPSW